MSMRVSDEQLAADLAEMDALAPILSEQNERIRAYLRELQEAREALREGAERGESEAIRAWCSLTLEALGGGS